MIENFLAGIPHTVVYFVDILIIGVYQKNTKQTQRRSYGDLLRQVCVSKRRSAILVLRPWNI